MSGFYFMVAYIADFSKKVNVGNLIYPFVTVHVCILSERSLDLNSRACGGTCDSLESPSKVT